MSEHEPLLNKSELVDNYNSYYSTTIETAQNYQNSKSKLLINFKKRKNPKKLKKKLTTKKSLGYFRVILLDQKYLLLICFVLQVMQVFGQLLGPQMTGEIIELASTNHIDNSFHKNNALINGACLISQSFIGCDTKRRLALTIFIEYILIAFVVGFVSFLGNGHKRKLSQNILFSLRCKLFKSLMYKDISEFDKTGSGEMLNRLSSDITEIGDVLSLEITNRMGSLFLVIGCFIYVTFISWKLTLTLFTVFPFITYSSRKFGFYFKKQSKRNQDELAVAGNIASESLANIRTVRSFSQENYHVQNYTDRLDISRSIGIKLGWAKGQFRGMTLFMDGLGLAVVLYVGTLLVLEDGMSVAAFTTFILYCMKIKNQMKQLIELFSSVTTAIGATERVFNYINTSPEINVNFGLILNNKDNIIGNIKFNNVTFSYPMRPSFIILDNFNLEIKSNTITALVGTSGSGKSTITNLLMRFYNINSGNIIIDQKYNLNDFNITWFHNNIISIVRQEPILFQCSILDIVDICKKANCHNFITSFPDKYNTLVGERGVQLSGGQKQRIAIARALLMSPKILILDEATSALDSESEHLVDNALKKLMENRTVIVIAHRLSTIKNANQIVVLENGKIIEKGNHKQLMNKKNGKYKLLVKRQTQKNYSRSNSLSSDENTYNNIINDVLQINQNINE